MSARIEPAAEPYLPGPDEDLHKLVPAGMEPIGLFRTLAKTFSEAQLLELLVLAGQYRMISYVCNASGLALEAHVPRFPPRDPEAPQN